MKRTWSKEQIELLSEKYPDCTPIELQLLFPDKTPKAIRGKAKVLKLKKSKAKFRFSSNQIKLLKESYANSQNMDLAQRFGCSIHTIENKAHSLGLKKDIEFIREMARIRSSNPNHGGRRTCFKKGNIPPNKGKKWKRS